jgi:hypothetical protein
MQAVAVRLRPAASIINRAHSRSAERNCPQLDRREFVAGL